MRESRKITDRTYVWDIEILMNFIYDSYDSYLHILVLNLLFYREILIKYYFITKKYNIFDILIFWLNIYIYYLLY